MFLTGTKCLKLIQFPANAIELIPPVSLVYHWNDLIPSLCGYYVVQDNGPCGFKNVTSKSNQDIFQLHWVRITYTAYHAISISNLASLACGVLILQSLVPHKVPNGHTISRSIQITSDLVHVFCHYAFLCLLIFTSSVTDT